MFHIDNKGNGQSAVSECHTRGGRRAAGGPRLRGRGSVLPPRQPRMLKGIGAPTLGRRAGTGRWLACVISKRPWPVRGAHRHRSCSDRLRRVNNLPRVCGHRTGSVSAPPNAGGSSRASSGRSGVAEYINSKKNSRSFSLCLNAWPATTSSERETTLFSPVMSHSARAGPLPANDRPAQALPALSARGRPLSSVAASAVQRAAARARPEVSAGHNTLSAFIPQRVSPYIGLGDFVRTEVRSVGGGRGGDHIGPSACACDALIRLHTNTIQ
ncbi:hypothetical protein EVAR_11079_1 [Eumeta japonica]|uniref:Uncharacterized protein n=1 Tax=Eumeta variegata TaxID=151549 RepID=A0A4C1U463_EUMVA|nr:hypothetical protein EVAR_11079_1 [Eumeta japonica]